MKKISSNCDKIPMFSKSAVIELKKLSVHDSLVGSIVELVMS